jgi:hypothetical protein
MGAGQQLSQEQIDHIWQSGYCPVLVEHAKTTDGGPMGAVSRTAFLEVHVKMCRDCYHATVMKTVEENAAALMGNETFTAFHRGEKITDKPGFEEAMKTAVRGLLQSKHATNTFFEWWRRVVSRKSYAEDMSHGQEAN